MVDAAQRFINGRFGTLYLSDIGYMAGVQEVRATIAFDFTPISVPGRLQRGQKLSGKTMTGNLRMNRSTSLWARFAALNIPPSNLVLRYELNDPESFGMEEAELTGVRFTGFPVGYGLDDVPVVDAIDFVFTGFRLIQGIDPSHLQDSSLPNYTDPAFTEALLPLP